MKEKDKRKEYRYLLYVIGIVFLFALAYSFYFQIEPSVDARAYDNIAWNLVQGNGYKEAAELSYDEDIAILRVGPGYEFFLAGVYKIFGHHILVVWIINALLTALSAFFVYLITKEIFREKWSIPLGLIAAGLIGFSPDLITVNGMLMTETLGVFLIILSVYLFFKYVNNEQKPVALIMVLGLVFGYSVLVRTPAALLFIPFAGYLLYEKCWKQLILFCVILLFVFTPWTVRNYEVYGTFIPTNLAFGYDLLAGNHPEATGELEPYQRNEEFIAHGRIEGNKLALKESLSFIAYHPIQFLEITLKRISIYFSFARPTGFWFHLEGWSKAFTLGFSALYSVLLFILGFYGMYYAYKQEENEQKRRLRYLFWMFLMMPLAVVFIIVETRYRFLSYPFFAIFAAYGFMQLLLHKIEWKPAIYILGFLFTNVTIDVWRNSDRVIERITNLF